VDQGGKPIVVNPKVYRLGNNASLNTMIDIAIASSASKITAKIRREQIGPVFLKD
jgi:hypothetical protein